MRHFIYILMLIAAMALFGGQGLLATSAHTNGEPRHVESYIYVSGGVHKPGRYEWRKGMTLIDAIQAAGGFTDSAGRKVRIFHMDGASELYTREGTNAPPILNAGDKISVPKRLL